MGFFLAHSAMCCFLLFFPPSLFPQLHIGFVFYGWLRGAWNARLCSTAINTTLVRPLRESTSGFIWGQTPFITGVLWCELWAAVAVFMGRKPPDSIGVQRCFDRSTHKTIASRWQLFVVWQWASQATKTIEEVHYETWNWFSLADWLPDFSFHSQSAPDNGDREAALYFPNVVTVYSFTHSHTPCYCENQGRVQKLSPQIRDVNSLRYLIAINRVVSTG